MSETEMNKKCQTISHVMLPQDANPDGNVHGGTIMKLIDNAAAVVAMRHARTTVVTASIDRLDFHKPVHIGNLLILKAGLNLTGRTSMEIGIRVEAENLITGTINHIASAYLTLVALENGRPTEIPAYLPTDSEAIRRQTNAIERKKKLTQTICK